MLVNRVEQHQINKTHPMFKVIDTFCFRSKNLYNLGNYIIRQEFINNKNWIRYKKLDKMLQKDEAYKLLMSQASQCTLQVLDRNWKSFFNGMKEYKKNPDKFLGMPKLPRYKKKDGRFTWFLKNNQTYIKDGYLNFKLKAFNGYKFKTSCNNRLISVRFVPKGNIYVMEIVFEKEINEEYSNVNNNICGIDLGVNNFVTIVNNIGLKPIIINGKGIKSINQNFNKKKAKIQSELQIRHGKHWSNRVDTLNRRRFNKIKNFMHNASGYIIKYCIQNNIGNLVVGLNKTWKQNCEMSDKNTQNFVFIPYDMFIEQLKYKCQDSGIRFEITEESYTSGTSFLDNEDPVKENYDKSRRIKRGLFKSNSGKLINSDVNGALQIIKKVFPDAFSYGIKGSLTPVIINLVKC